MHVGTVCDQFADHAVVSQQRTNRTRSSVVERLHSIESMCRVPRASVDCLANQFWRRRGVSH
jgi:hypothetical protein